MLFAQSKETLGKGEETAIKFADFIDYGLYLIHQRQTRISTAENYVEAVTADKMFRLLYKLSISLCDESEQSFDLRIGLDRNGRNGKGIAFPLKSIKPESEDLEEDNSGDFVLKEKTCTQPLRRKEQLYACDAIKYLETTFLPPEYRRLKVEILDDGREVYGTTLGHMEFEEWMGNKRLNKNNARLLEIFSSFINRLNDRELICLGRHENLENTENSIIFLCENWKRGMDEILKMLKLFETQQKWPDSDFLGKINELHQYAEEVLLKSTTDKDDYEKALNELQKESYPQIRKLLAIQSSSDSIWNSPRIQCFVFFGYLFNLFTTFIFMALAFHTKSNYTIPSYVQKKLPSDYESIPFLIVKMLKIDRLTKASYSEATHEAIIQKQTHEELVAPIIDLQSFREGNLSSFVTFYDHLLMSIWEAYTDIIGPKSLKTGQLELYHGKNIR